MIAVDTNVLVYAHREEFGLHRSALAALKGLAESHAAWALPVFVLGDFLRVVTHPHVLKPPGRPQEGLEFLDGLLGSAGLRVLHPGARYWPLLRDSVGREKARGNLVFDAQIVAVCLEHGVDTILSEDRGLRRFARIRLNTLGGP